MNFLITKNLGNHLLQLCPKVVKHPVYPLFAILLHQLLAYYLVPVTLQDNADQRFSISKFMNLVCKIFGTAPRLAHRKYSNSCPQNRRYSPLGRCHLRISRISLWMTSFSYPSWKHSRSTLSQSTLLETLDVFCLCAVVEQSVAPTSISSAVPHMDSRPPHCARHTHSQSTALISWSLKPRTQTHIHVPTRLLTHHPSGHVYKSVHVLVRAASMISVEYECL